MSDRVNVIIIAGEPITEVFILFVLYSKDNK